MITWRWQHHDEILTYERWNNISFRCMSSRWDKIKLMFYHIPTLFLLLLVPTATFLAHIVDSTPDSLSLSCHSFPYIIFPAAADAPQFSPKRSTQEIYHHHVTSSWMVKSVLWENTTLALSYFKWTFKINWKMLFKKAHTKMRKKLGWRLHDFFTLIHPQRIFNFLTSWNKAFHIHEEERRTGRQWDENDDGKWE